MLIRMLIAVAMLMLAACASENNPVYQTTADSAMKAATYEEAIKAFESSINEKYHSYKYYEARAAIADKYDRYGEAINDYTRSMTIMTSDDLNMKRAIDYYKLKYYQDAEYDFTAVMMTSAKYRMSAYAWRAKARVAQGKYADALDDLNKVIKLGSETAEVDKTMAEVYQSLGDTQKAMTYVAKAVSANPDDPELYYLRGKLFYKTKDANQALNDYKKALALKPDYTEAKYALAWLYATCPAGIYRDTAQAVPMAEELFKVDSSSANAILLAAAYASNGDFDKASSLLKTQADKEEDQVLQDDMRVYLKQYQEKKTLNTW